MPDDSRRRGSKRDGFEIRAAHLADIDALVRLEAECFASDKLSRRSFLRFAKSPSAAFLIACRADRKEDPVGYAIVLFRRGGRSARLYSIAVSSEAAGRGAGSGLLAAAEAIARRRGAERLHLEVRADNPSAIRLYRLKGYRELGARDGYYEDGMRALLFSRALAVVASTTAAQRGLRRAA
jgi:[ribosomal protein S18]-alanine N-acetyltransferase